eukprot:6180135-Pleurochrysis_carterae.AAC.2
MYHSSSAHADRISVRAGKSACHCFQKRLVSFGALLRESQRKGLMSYHGLFQSWSNALRDCTVLGYQKVLNQFYHFERRFFKEFRLRALSRARKQIHCPLYTDKAKPLKEPSNIVRVGRELKQQGVLRRHEDLVADCLERRSGNQLRDAECGDRKSGRAADRPKHS